MCCFLRGNQPERVSNTATSEGLIVTYGRRRDEIAKISCEIPFYVRIQGVSAQNHRGRLYPKEGGSVGGLVTIWEALEYVLWMFKGVNGSSMENSDEYSQTDKQKKVHFSFVRGETETAVTNLDLKTSESLQFCVNTKK
jgi:hypothetical protein